MKVPKNCPTAKFSQKQYFYKVYAKIECCVVNLFLRVTGEPIVSEIVDIFVLKNARNVFVQNDKILEEFFHACGFWKCFSFLHLVTWHVPLQWRFERDYQRKMGQRASFGEISDHFLSNFRINFAQGTESRVNASFSRFLGGALLFVRTSNVWLWLCSIFNAAWEETLQLRETQFDYKLSI